MRLFIPAPVAPNTPQGLQEVGTAPRLTHVVSFVGDSDKTFQFRSLKEAALFALPVKEAGKYTSGSTTYHIRQVTIKKLPLVKQGEPVYIQGEGADTFQVNGMLACGSNYFVYLTDNGTEYCHKVYPMHLRTPFPTVSEEGWVELARATIEKDKRLETNQRALVLPGEAEAMDIGVDLV